MHFFSLCCSTGFDGAFSSQAMSPPASCALENLAVSRGGERRRPLGEGAGVRWDGPWLDGGEPASLGLHSTYSLQDTARAGQKSRGCDGQGAPCALSATRLRDGLALGSLTSLGAPSDPPPMWLHPIPS